MTPGTFPGAIDPAVSLEQRSNAGEHATLWGYPKGLWLVASTELWERFSYWGLLAILVLFLTAGVEAGGLGWARLDAIKLYGVYAGAAFIAPLLGGWIANNYWGERRCILLGGLLIVAGHLCLAGLAAIPWLAAQFIAPTVKIDFLSLWATAKVPLGQLALSAEHVKQITAAAAAHDVPVTLALAVYRLTASSFFGGLLLIVIGTGLIKPTISSIIGHFFGEGDQRRDAAFGVFFAAIYIGCILGTFVVGFLGERVGWHWGFAAAAIGMVMSVAVYLCKQQDYLGHLGVAPVGVGGGPAALRALTPEERDRIKVIAWQGCFSVLYAAAFFQAGGLLMLFIDQQLDRRLAGWTIPATWLINVATISFVALTPVAIRYWRRLERQGRAPSAPVKLAWGLLVIGSAYLLLACLAAAEVDPHDAKVSWLWMALVYLCFGISDLLVWPNQIALTSRLAPRALATLFVGGWYVTIGIGTWMTGYIGALSEVWGLRTLFFVMACALLLLGMLAWRLAPRMLRLSHGLER